MKKMVAVIIMITLFIGTFALAETVELSQYNDTEMISLLEAVQQENADRHIERSANLPQGSYLAGKDIPAGSYDISVEYKGSMWMDVYIYADGGNGEMIQDYTVFADGSYGDGTGNFHVELTDGTPPATSEHSTKESAGHHRAKHTAAISAMHSHARLHHRPTAHSRATHRAMMHSHAGSHAMSHPRAAKAATTGASTIHSIHCSSPPFLLIQ